MHTKQALLENLNSLTPEAKGALIGSLIGAGGVGLAGAFGSKKNKLRNGLLGMLAGGLGGGAAGYFSQGGKMQNVLSTLQNPFDTNEQYPTNYQY